jgi:hypothetical protein
MTDDKQTAAMRKAFESHCKKINSYYSPGDDGILNRRDWEMWQAATLVERERCAKVAETINNGCTGAPDGPEEIAAAIREGEALEGGT